MQKFKDSEGRIFNAQGLIDGVLIDPKLPRNFDNTPNERRPRTQAKWWGRPFIVTTTVDELDDFYAKRTGVHAESARRDWAGKGRSAWMAAWPSGTRYETRCLDGGAWDRSTWWGAYATVEEAVQRAKAGYRT